MIGKGKLRGLRGLRRKEQSTLRIVIISGDRLYPAYLSGAENRLDALRYLSEMRFLDLS